MTQAHIHATIGHPSNGTQAPPSEADGRTLGTRFGQVRIDGEREIAFPVGLLGFPGHRRYVLSGLPDRPGPFKLLQAADDPDLGFLVLPLEREGGPIAGDDLEAACAQLAIDGEALAVLGVVTLRPETAGVVTTVNLKAPLLIDTARRRGWQVVLPSDGYDLRHPLAPGSPHVR
jgi:flagellar assembly factor FliW